MTSQSTQLKSLATTDVGANLGYNLFLAHYNDNSTHYNETGSAIFVRNPDGQTTMLQVMQNEFKKAVKDYGYCDETHTGNKHSDKHSDKQNDLSPLNIALIITSSVLFIALLISLFNGKSKGKRKK